MLARIADDVNVLANGMRYTSGEHESIERPLQRAQRMSAADRTRAAQERAMKVRERLEATSWKEVTEDG